MGKLFKKYTIRFYVGVGDQWFEVSSRKYWSRRRIEAVSLNYCLLMRQMGLSARTYFGKGV